MRRKFWVFVRIFAYDKERGKRKMHWWAKSRAFGGFVLIPYAMIFLTWSFFAPQAFAGAARPNIKDSKDWKKMDASQLTGDWRDNRKIIWRNISRNKGTQRKYSGALVVRADGKGNADIWADNFGLHFFDKATHKVKTPIDLSPLGLKHGPEIDYVFGSDGSLSYFYVQWCKTKIGIGQKQHLKNGFIGCALMDVDGNVLWKKLKTFPPYDQRYIAWVLVSAEGRVLVAKASGETDSDEDFDSWEILDKAGKKVGRLPVVPSKIRWSSDGKEIQCGEKPILTIYDQNGNYLRGAK